MLNFQRELENEELVTCPECDGSGVYEHYYNEYDIVDLECPRCMGEGKINDIYDNSR